MSTRIDHAVSEMELESVRRHPFGLRACPPQALPKPLDADIRLSRGPPDTPPSRCIIEPFIGQRVENICSELAWSPRRRLPALGLL